ncbi:hypothetical protein V6N13_028522 [Hibiscus sabdariffa]
MLSSLCAMPFDYFGFGTDCAWCSCWHSSTGERWQPPVSEWYKLNTNGSRVSSTRFASYGGVLRNSIGDWIVGFKKYVGICSIAVAERWGVWTRVSVRFSWKLIAFMCFKF